RSVSGRPHAAPFRRLAFIAAGRAHDCMRGAQKTVLVFSGLDPSGGAGMTADVLAIAAQGVHPLSVVTALTVQDHNRVHAVVPVDPDLLERQALALIDSTAIDAVKIGIPGSQVNAQL